VIDVGLAVVGWIDLLATATVAGGLLFGALVGAPSAAGERVIRRALAVLAGVLALAFVLTALRMRTVSGIGGGALVVDLLETRWGGLWTLRVLGVAVLAGTPPPLYPAIVGPWLALRSFQGHAGAHGVVAAMIDWLHLLAAAAWIGGLVQLALLARPISMDVGRRMRTLATVALGALIPSGVYAAFLHIPSLDMVTESPYGRALVLKLVLAAVLIALGAVNHFRHVPGMLRGDATAAARLGALVRVEVLLAAAVLLVTAVLGVLPMPHVHHHA